MGPEGACNGVPVNSSLQDIFICIQGDFLRPHWQQDIAAFCGVAADSDLAQTHHPLSEIRENWHQHGKLRVNLALSNGHVKLHFTAIGWTELLIDAISMHL